MARDNRTRVAVLGMLSTGARSGYDLKKEFERPVGHFWAESVGQIYPALKALSHDGLVRARDGAGTGRRPRTVYAITARGRRALRRWLEEAPQAEQVRNELLLKFYFGPAMGADTALSHLENFARRQRATIDTLEGFTQEIEATANTDEQEFFWKLTLSSGLHVARARLAWCDEARRRLRAWQRSRSRSGSADQRRRRAS